MKIDRRKQLKARKRKMLYEKRKKFEKEEIKDSAKYSKRLKMGNSKKVDLTEHEMIRIYERAFPNNDIEVDFNKLIDNDGEQVTCSIKEVTKAYKSLNRTCTDPFGISHKFMKIFKGQIIELIWHVATYILKFKPFQKYLKSRTYP